ncbi:MAG: flagellar basal-body rod protein FlgG, partial [Myxococcota bacterium]
RALFTAATGMLAQERKIDVIANNLANVNTDGFKGSRAEFQDLMYQTLRSAGAGGSAVRATATGTQVGLGVKDGAIVRDFSQGALKNTGKPTDLAISGSGFFVVRLDDGEFRLTRNGAFRMSSEGEMVTKEGYPLWPIVQVPLEQRGLAISPDGRIEVAMSDGQRRQIGQLQLAEVLNIDALEATGDNLFSVSDFDRNVRLTQPGEAGTGRLEAGFLEGSNVKVVEEMIAMITGQRAYEANSRVIQTADRMMEETNRLR